MRYGNGKSNPRLLLVILCGLGAVAAFVAIGLRFFPIIAGNVFFTGIGVAFCFTAVYGYKTGRIPGHGEWYTRREKPMLFWMNMVFFGAGGILIALWMIISW